MDGLVINLGIIGLSPENGHPYSFSAIINGFDEVEMEKSGWTGILNYLRKVPANKIGFDDANITHVWTQDASISDSISKSCYIDNIVNNYTDMVNSVDGVIIARDDFKRHLEMARPFLENGIPVFVDKPLTTSEVEMEYYLPFLESGLLMSCSGLRYAKELDPLRLNPEGLIGELRGISCGVVNGWEKYGIHMLDAILGVYPHIIPSRIIRHPSSGESITLETSNNEVIHIHCLGKNAPLFSLTFFGENGVFTTNISDNFTAFSRTMRQFVKQVKSGSPSIPVDITKVSMEVIGAGSRVSEGEIIEFQTS